jgi:hypothetical protein
MAVNPLFSGMGSLVHELRGSITYISGIYRALDEKLPAPASEIWNELGYVSERVFMEIEDSLGAMLANIDSYSPAMAVARMHVLACGWEKDVEQLSLISNRIYGLRIHFEDPRLDAVLNEYLRSSIQRFGTIVSFVKQIQPEDLLFD